MLYFKKKWSCFSFRSTRWSFSGNQLSYWSAEKKKKNIAATLSFYFSEAVAKKDRWILDDGPVWFLEKESERSLDMEEDEGEVAWWLSQWSLVVVLGWNRGDEVVWLLCGFRYGAGEVKVFAAGTGRIPVSSPFFLQHVSATFIYRRSLERYQLSSSFPSSPFNPLLINPCPS